MVSAIIGALILLAIVLLAVEHIAGANRRMNADLAEFNEAHPRRHLRVVGNDQT